jgi:3-oxoacyl-[acyl-carrier protein] reductase
MLERGYGRIVNLASTVGWGAPANQAAYAAAKAGVMAFTRAVAAEVVRAGIRVNAVAPSFALNPFLERIYPKETLAELEQRAIFGRGADPAEIANVILFLASDLSSYMTGEVLSVSNQHP